MAISADIFAVLLQYFKSSIKNLIIIIDKQKRSKDEKIKSIMCNAGKLKHYH